LFIRMHAPAMRIAACIKIFFSENVLFHTVFNIFALATQIRFPTYYLLIFPEKNHGILAGRYSKKSEFGLKPITIKKFLKLRQPTKLFSFKLFWYLIVCNDILLMVIS
jgi:hypothetical protein